MSNRESVAYDFSRFEPRSNAVRKPEEEAPASAPERTRKKSKAAVRPFIKPAAAVKWTAVAALVLSSLVALMVSNVQLNELNTSVTAAQKKLQSAQSEEIALNMQLQSKMSLQKVEDAAVSQLHMQKIDAYQIQYIRLTDKDSVVLTPRSTSLLARTEDLFEGILEYFE